MFEEISPEMKRKAATFGDVLEVMVRAAKVFKGQLQSINTRIRDLESGSASAERIAELIGKVNVLEMKCQELQRQADAHKKHLSNIESKIERSKPWPGTK